MLNTCCLFTEEHQLELEVKKVIGRVTCFRISGSSVDLRREVWRKKPDLVLIDQQVLDNRNTMLIEQILFQGIPVILIGNSKALHFQSFESDPLFFKIVRREMYRELSVYLQVIQKLLPQLRKLNHKISQLEKKNDEIRYLADAKLLLITQRGMSEKSSYDYIRKLSMNERVSKEVIAKRIIKQLKGEI